MDTTLKREKKKIEFYLERLSGQRFSGSLSGACGYTVNAGGKRLRPILMVAMYRALGGRRKSVYPISLSIELIHSYSLIHDDLPQLDNDDYRRGKYTCHKVFGTQTALLAGVDLIGSSVGNIVSAGRRARLGGDTIRQLTAELMRASGVHGLVGGQVADIIYESREFDERSLQYIHKHKTAVLFAAATSMAAILAGIKKQKMGHVREYGMQLGFAFQVIDDILDTIGTFEDLGKKVGKDASQGKATFPALFGVDGARERAKAHISNAVDLLDLAGLNDRFLRLLPLWIQGSAC